MKIRLMVFSTSGSDNSDMPSAQRPAEPTYTHSGDKHTPRDYSCLPCLRVSDFPNRGYDVLGKLKRIINVQIYDIFTIFLLVREYAYSSVFDVGFPP